MTSQRASEDLDLRPKRMRLGTRSCAECRRRKVKCVFPEDAAVCHGCKLHDVPCSPQIPRAREKRKAGEDESNEAALKQRLEELEGVVRQVCGAVGLDAESATMSQFKMGTAEALRRIQESYRPPPSLGSGPEDSLQGLSTPYKPSPVAPCSSDSGFSEKTHSPETSDVVGTFDDAPLITMFKDAMLIQKRAAPSTTKASDDVADSTPGTQVWDILRPILHLVPTPVDLKLILEKTEVYWALWPPCHTGADSSEPSETLQGGGVPLALNFISTGLESGDPVLVAKVLPFLGMCLHQLPTIWLLNHVSLPATSQVIKEAFVQATNLLLTLAAEHGDSPDSVEGYMLLHRLYMDMGFPRKAWLTIRQAMNAALVLGLHRKNAWLDIDPSRNVWPYIWQVERLLSAVLGMPSAVPDWHMALSRELVGPEPMHRLAHEVGRIIGAVIQRDQAPGDSSYAVTVQLDQDWERCRNIMPAEFWTSPPSPGTPLAALYHRQHLKLAYWTAGQLIHIPYLNKAAEDRRFEISRISCLEACKGIIHDYKDMRNGGLKIVMCELMDFKAFSAAVTLALSMLLSPKPDPHAADSAAASQDWALVEDVTRDLRATGGQLDCVVASQAAQLLEFLIMLHNGTYNGPDRYEATVPYFGRVRISCKHMKGASRPSPGSDQTSLSFETHSQQTSPLLQFNAVPFPFNFDNPFDSGPELELQCDWVTSNYPTTFDWVEVLDT
ncbi:hypothetical protein GQ53DRAFT_743247 [Thozetella sp. PMI_491]|nr:hypothetical protein GQ53DRAFT_743247 [Thozetella sp. PMI_491]